MFGGHGVYRDGVIIAIVIDEGDLPEGGRGNPRRVRGSANASPSCTKRRAKAVPMSYWSVPEDALDSPQEFRPWAQRAWEAALRKPKPKPKKAAAKGGEEAVKKTRG